MSEPKKKALPTPPTAGNTAPSTTTASQAPALPPKTKTAPKLPPKLPPKVKEGVVLMAKKIRTDSFYRFEVYF